MKLKTCFILLNCFAPLQAATVVMSVTGRVSETDADAFFPAAPVAVGDTWTVTFVYTHPYPPAPPVGIGEVNYYVTDGRMDFMVNGLFWHGEGFGVRFAPLLNWDVQYASNPSVPNEIATGGERSTAVLNWAVPFSLIRDNTSLPDSFDDWDLPGAVSFRLNVVTQRGSTGANFWYIRANQIDTISIQVIPEPSTAVLAGFVAVTTMGRRRRLRA